MKEIKMRKIAIGVVASVVLCAGCGGGSGDDTTGNDAKACNLIGLQPRSEKVINGTTCRDPQGSAIVRLVTVDGEGRITSTFCTGSVIEPTKVLTAGHCIGAFDPNQAVGVLTGQGPNFEGAYAVTYSLAPGYNESSGEAIFNDAMVLTLQTPLNVPILPVLISRAVNVDETGYVYGYGRTVQGDGPDPDQGLELQAGRMTVRNVTPNHIFVRFDGDGVNVCNGDSGGPLIVEVGGQPAIAGVVSTGSVAGCRAGDTTLYTNLQSESLLTWLASKAPNAIVR
jgi:secreted trypsin-like serine protease